MLNNTSPKKQWKIGGRAGSAVVSKQGKLKKKTNKKSSIQKSKKTKRSKSKYPALDPKLNLKSRTELLDYDYLNKLSEEELKWLNKFTEEYVNASLDTKNPRKNLHRNKKLRIDCYNRNNSRNRDVLTRGKVMNKIDGVEKIQMMGYEEEDKIHAAIDAEIYFKSYTQKKKRKINS